MIFFVGNDGTVINSFPSPVYQGSANANNIYLVAPFAANLQVTVAFKLPNGVWTERYLMTQVNEIEGVVNKETGKPYVGWQFSMPNEITQYYGTVSVQFFFYAGQGSVLTASSSTSFTVGRGVPEILPDEILPDEPSADIYNQILDNLSIFTQEANNGAFAARSIYAWNSTYTYGANEIVYYPDVGKYGVFLKSLVINNMQEPYSDGVLNSGEWEEVVDFNILNELYTLKGDTQEALSQAQANANAAAQSAASAASSSGNAAQSAAVAQNAAARVENSAEYLENVQSGAEAVPKASADGTGTNIAEQFATVTSDIEGLREDINNEAHFKGVFTSVEALKEAYPTATPNDYAYISGGNEWIYENGEWTDSGTAVPDSLVPASNTSPLMDGTASVGSETAYARGDHRHPSDTTKADLSGADFDGDISAPTVTGADGIYDGEERVYSPNNPPPTGSAPSDAAPLMDGVANAGSSVLYSRGDHKHPSDTAKVNKSGDAMSGNLSIVKASGDTFLYTRRTDKDNELRFGIGDGGVNRGIYDKALNKWIFHTDGTNVYINGVVPYSANNPPPSYVKAFVNNASKGYIKFANGFTIQWGKDTNTTNKRAITFPVTFNTVYSVQVNYEHYEKTSNGWGYAYNITNAGFNVVADVAIDWVAFGYITP